MLAGGKWHEWGNLPSGTFGADRSLSFLRLDLPLFDPLHLKAAFVFSALIGGIKGISLDRAQVGVAPASPFGHVMGAGEADVLLILSNALLRAISTTEDAGPGGVVMEIMRPFRILGWTDNAA